jgi:repressor|nr:MAG TPA: helix-turn-helix domain protein [Caudoviricetes sp.]
MNIYDNIVYLANLKNLTIKDLEFRAGISNGSIRRWNDIDPGISKVKAVANVLGVSIENILYGTSVKNHNSSRGTLNKSGYLNNLQPGSSDFNFGLTDLIDGYDKIRYLYSFISSENNLISEKTIFIFDRFIDSTVPRYDVIDNRLNNQIVLIFSYHFHRYYIGRLKYVQGMINPVFLSFDPSLPNLTIDSSMTILISICRFIFIQN